MFDTPQDLLRKSSSLPHFAKASILTQLFATARLYFPLSRNCTPLHSAMRILAIMSTSQCKGTSINGSDFFSITFGVANEPADQHSRTRQAPAVGNCGRSSIQAPISLLWCVPIILVLTIFAHESFLVGTT